MPRWVKALILFAIIVVGFVVYRRSKSSQGQPPQYQTAKIEQGTITATISVSGSVTTSNSRTVTTTASGVVKKVYVKEGQKVTVGTPILSIDLDLNGRQKYQSAYSSYQSAQNNLKSAQNKILDLESTLVNAKNIFDNQWSGKSPDDPTYKQKYNDYLSAQASYDNQQNVIKQVQSSLEASRLAFQLASATVYSPISGTVSAVSLTPGMILNPTSDSANSSNSENKIAIVKTAANPSISVSLTETDVSRVKVGHKAVIVLDAYPDKTFSGSVIAVDTTGTVASGVVSYPATILFDTGSDDILPNMSVSVNIITNSKTDILKVESSAVQSQSGQTVLRVIKNGQLDYLPVEVGLRSDSEVEIVSGATLGQEVVTNIINPTSSSSSGSGTSVFGSFSQQGGANRMMRLP